MRSTDDPFDVNQECAAEPIRIPGAVQSHGLLIAMRMSDFTVLQVSENTREILGTEPEQILHQPLSRLMNVDVVERAKHRIGERVPRILNPLPIEITVNGHMRQFDGILHRSGRVLILELEPHVESYLSHGGVGGLYETMRTVISRIMDANSLEQVLALSCEELRRLTGFSRVLVYKFDQNWDGQVIATSSAEGTETLANHRFPAADIPKQARELYVVNWLRIIPDVHYKPAKLVPQINPITEAPTDLSNAVLRSVSPVHLEYMRNMGFDASMSISLLKKGQLWGLIACHNVEPRALPFEMRVAAEFLGQVISSQISAREATVVRKTPQYLKTFLEELLHFGGTYKAVIPAFKFNPSIGLGLVDAQGLALLWDGGYDCVGVVPPKSEVEYISQNLGLHLGEPLCTRHVVRDLKLDREVVNSAGLLAFDVGGVKGLRLIFFRPERVESIAWGGDPRSTKERASDGRIKPRKSFETWIETVRGSSAEWQPGEVKAAVELKKILDGLWPQNAGSLPDAATFANPASQNVPPRTERTVVRAGLSEAKDSSLAPGPTSDADRPDFAIDFLDLALANLDAKGRFRRWSSGAQRLLGYTSEDVEGQTLDYLFSEEDRLRGIQDTILSETRSHQIFTHEAWAYRADRSSFWAKMRFQLQVHPHQREASFALIIEDITSEKTSEEELKATKVAAEAASVAKSSFLANISHEIRTPLGAVLGFAELLARCETSEERARLYQRIETNGNQLLTLINDLLDMTKVESNKLEVEDIEFEFYPFINDLHDTFSLKAHEKGVDFNISMPAPLPRRVFSDPTRLRQILVNLLSNAIKFTDGGGRVTLEAAFTQRLGKARLEFRVIDSGRGMTEQEMSRLFEPFVQADISTTRKYGGTGLGLFVSQRIARLLHGDLSIEHSKAGEGSTFLLSIEPVRPVSAETFASMKNAVVSTSEGPIRPTTALGGLKILIVDDSSDNRELIDIFLRGQGAELEQAENGQVAIETCARERFDVILMDIQMPVMDGKTAARNLIASGIRTPILALTAHAMADERLSVLDIGFAGYITKPINWKDLIEHCRDLGRRN